MSLSSAASNAASRPSDTPPPTVKVLIAGGYGVGKTTLVGAVSEITPLRTEERLTEAGIGVDAITVAGKTTTTVAMDFGRITLPGVATLLLFGTPGQERFWFMWDDLLRGTIGAVVLVDQRNLVSSFPAIDFFEERGTPFVVAVNCFGGAQPYNDEQIRAALVLKDPRTAVLMVDARIPDSGRAVLVALLDQLITRSGQDGAPAQGMSVC